MKFRFSALFLVMTISALSASSGFTQAQQTTPAENPFGTAAPPESPALKNTQPTTRAPRKVRATTPAAALKTGQFASEAEAKASCPGDAVVWANTSSKIYHHAGTRSYGKTKRGAYMCEKETSAAGIRAAKNEKSR